MSFFNNIKKVLHFGGNDAKKKKVYNNVKMETDPEEYWDMIGELGDGAYGKVYKVFSSRITRFIIFTNRGKNRAKLKTKSVIFNHKLYSSMILVTK